MKLHICLSSLLIALILSGCASEQKKTVLREIPREQRSGLMVLNFKNSTPGKNAKEYEPWEFGIPSMIMTDIESIGLFNIISKENLKDILKQQEFEQSGLVETSKAVKIGKLVSAKYILTGSFTEMNGNLRIETRVLSVEKGTQLGAASVTGKIDTFFDMEKQLIIKISKYLNAMLTEKEASMIAGNIETKSIDASLNNYAGEVALIKADELKRNGETEMAEAVINKARSSFKSALRYDPDYTRAKRNLASLSMGMPMTL